MADDWYVLDNAGDVPSPALIVYRARAEENIRRMVRQAGAPSRLRPHLKTTKLTQIVRAFLAEGVDRFKVATLGEARMAAAAGACDVLLGYPPVGPNVRLLLDLMAAFPAAAFSALVDDERALEALAAAASARDVTVPLFLDLDVGMHRTGMAPGPDALAFYQRMAALPGVQPAGLHAYDGHIRDTDPAARRARCDEAFRPVADLRAEIGRRGLPAPIVVAGGSPTFPVHAGRADVECSPGTLVFSDLCTLRTFPDLDYLPAALVLTRVVSHPGRRRLCLDLGHKAIAAENPHPRVALLNLPDATAVGHSEEHLVVETDRAADVQVGTCLYGVPWHVCPTVALYDEAVIAEGGRATERWPIARGRTIGL
jgi:D-serine deaminase-like pyridoxal phosphate-dependent protein